MIFTGLATGTVGNKAQKAGVMASEKRAEDTNLKQKVQKVWKTLAFLQ